MLRLSAPIFSRAIQHVNSKPSVPAPLVFHRTPLEAYLPYPPSAFSATPKTGEERTDGMEEREGARE
eukprot:1936089-Pyramimonas_sp.AAC.1